METTVFLLVELVKDILDLGSEANPFLILTVSLVWFIRRQILSFIGRQVLSFIGRQILKNSSHLRGASTYPQQPSPRSVKGSGVSGSPPLNPSTQTGSRRIKLKVELLLVFWK